MAELKGPILFTGSIGTIRAYYDKVLKKYFVSTKGGSTKDLINNNPNLERQRENMIEFKACTKWASQLRRALIDILHLCEGYYFSEIVALAKLIQKQDDEGLRGHRTIASSKFSRLLPGFNFNPIHPFDQVFAHQYDVQFSDDKRTVTLQLLGFRSFSRINWPSRYAAYRLTLVIFQQPDWAWSEQDGSFKPVLPELNHTSTTVHTDWKAPSTTPEDIILTASFAQPALQKPGTTVVVALGIEVSPFPLDASIINMTGVGTMKIVACYV
jgi:hypothetical protein